MITLDDFEELTDDSIDCRRKAVLLSVLVHV